MNFEKVLAERPTKIIYKDGNNVIKLFNDPEKKVDVLNEALNHARIEETGLCVPKIEEVTKIEGKWAIVMQYVEGKLLSKLMEENPDKLDEYLNLFVDLQLECHSKTAPLLNKLHDKMSRKIRMSGLDDAVKFELDAQLAEFPKHNKVLHGDFNPSNIIITADGKPFIIDWSHATQGNASADAARTYLLFSIADKNDVAKAYFELFCEKSKTQQKYVSKWLPIVAASQLVKDVPEERDFLMKWVSVCNYS